MGDGWTQPGGVGRRHDDGDGHTTLGQHAADVDHGDRVARPEPWEQDEVELSVTGVDVLHGRLKVNW